MQVNVCCIIKSENTLPLEVTERTLQGSYVRAATKSGIHVSSSSSGLSNPQILSPLPSPPDRSLNRSMLYRVTGPTSLHSLRHRESVGCFSENGNSGEDMEKSQFPEGTLADDKVSRVAAKGCLSGSLSLKGAI